MSASSPTSAQGAFADVQARIETILAEVVATRVAAFGASEADRAAASASGPVASLIALLPHPEPHLPDAVERLTTGDPLRLESRFGLDSVDHAIVLLALAPDLNPRLERVFRFLQDDDAGTRPAVGFALRLLVGEDGWHQQLARLSTGAPLRRLGLIQLVDGPLRTMPGAALVLPPDLLPQLSSGRSHQFVATVAAATSGLDREEEARLHGAWLRSLGDPVPRLGIVGNDPVRRQRAAAWLAGQAGGHLVVARSPAPGFDLEEWHAGVRRSALLERAVLFVGDAPEVLIGHPGPGIVGSQVPLVGGMPQVVLPRPGHDARGAAWREALGRTAVAELAAERLPLRTEAILRTAQIARSLARGAGRGLSYRDVVAAARSEAGRDLVALATQVDPRVSWSDLVLPAATLEQLRELCAWVSHRWRLWDRWGYSTRRGGRGVTALFVGPSGTGKSMAAEVVAQELGLPLWRIDLARTVSKYVGETEKNLDAIFEAGEAAGAMLVFDEADALFGKRGDVRHANDRYANLEVSYLLQRMEAYEGIAILTTNLRDNLDEAFTRRLAFVVSFPFPGVPERRLIWARAWPSATPKGDLDLAAVAEKYPLSGANITNAALAAAHAAAADGGVVRQSHVVAGVHRELAKLGVHDAEDAVSTWRTA